MKELKELQPLILEWAKEKDLLKADNAPKQRLKLIEECGELASAILKNDINEQKDAIGDIFVVLVILSEQTNTEINFYYEKSGYIVEDNISYYSYELIKTAFLDNDLEYFISYLTDICIKLNLNLEGCANIAWNEIKDRTGKTINGTFLKNEN